MKSHLYYEEFNLSSAQSAIKDQITGYAFICHSEFHKKSPKFYL